MQLLMAASLLISALHNGSRAGETSGSRNVDICTTARELADGHVFRITEGDQETDIIDSNQSEPAPCLLMDPLTKSEFAFSTLRAAVVNGELKPGDWIRAEDWAARLGLSETPVREALGRLEGLGLVDIRPHRGAQVKSRTRDHVIETYSIRTALEVQAARLAIERTNDKEYQVLLAAIEQLTGEMASEQAAGDVEKIRELNRQIHMTIYAAAGLPRMLALIEGLWAVYPFDTLTVMQGRTERALQEHQEILEAVRARDSDRLAVAFEEHLHAAQGVLMQGEIPGVTDP